LLQEINWRLNKFEAHVFSEVFPCAKTFIYVYFSGMCGMKAYHTLMRKKMSEREER